MTVYLDSTLGFFAVFNLADELRFDPGEVSGLHSACTLYVTPCIRIPCVNVPSNALKLLMGYGVTKGDRSPRSMARILIGLSDSKMKNMSVLKSPKRGGTRFHQVQVALPEPPGSCTSALRPQI